MIGFFTGLNAGFLIINVMSGKTGLVLLEIAVVSILAFLWSKE